MYLWMSMALCLVSVGHGKEVWAACDVLHGEHVTVQLLYRPEASLSDEEWIKLQFTRSGDADTELKNIHYRMESERFSPDGKTLISSGGLASGSSYDLFGKSRAWGNRGRITSAAHPSRYSSTLLGLAPKGGLLVRARLHLHFDRADGRRIKTPPEGVPFTFIWNRPDESGFAEMRERLKSLLNEAEPQSNSCHSYILGTLLEIPEVSGDISLSRILTAIDKRKGGFDGREPLVEHLEKWSSDPAEVRNHYLSLLERGDRRVCMDLHRAEWLWDRRFIEPLVAVHEMPKISPYWELNVLFAHSSEWVGDPEIPGRLSAPLLERYGKFLKRTPEELIENRQMQLQTWTHFAEDLGKTRDRKVIPLLVPFLSCTEAFADPRMAFSSTDGEALPYRACDVALESILTILDGETEKAYRAAQGLDSTGETTRFPYRRIRSNQVQTTALRDRMIFSLKERLEAVGEE